MVGFIFGIIFVIAGIIVGICLTCFKKTVEIEEYALDENKQPIKTAYGYRTTIKKTVKKPYAKYSVLAYVGGAFLGVLLTFFGCTASVDTGHVGIVKTFGKVEDYTFDSGFHLKAPWNSVTQMDNRVQKATVELSCFSSDIQEVTISYTVNYQISKTNAQNLYRDVGTNYLETVVNPTIQESVKTIVAQYKAEGDETNGGLVKNRAEVAEKIEVLLKKSLQKYDIDVVSTAIENMDFTDSFTNAVEAKAVAEQNRLKAETENKQALAQAENDRKIAETNAQAAAEVAKIQAEADKIVAQIGADSAEYQGKKEAAIALQRLASINGWTVITEKITVTENGVDKEIEVHTLYKADGTKVSDTELEEGAKRLIEYYYTQTWDGKLPDTFVGDGDISSIIVGNK